MKKLTKKYGVVYIESTKVIVAKIQNGSEDFPTIAGGDDSSEEFDTSEELERFISSEGLDETTFISKQQKDAEFNKGESML